MAFAMCLKFHVNKYSQPYTLAKAICVASVSAFRGRGPAGSINRFVISIIARLGGSDSVKESI